MRFILFSILFLLIFARAEAHVFKCVETLDGDIRRHGISKIQEEWEPRSYDYAKVQKRVPELFLPDIRDVKLSPEDEFFLYEEIKNKNAAALVVISRYHMGLVFKIFQQLGTNPEIVTDFHITYGHEYLDRYLTDYSMRELYKPFSKRSSKAQAIDQSQESVTFSTYAFPRLKTNLLRYLQRPSTSRRGKVSLDKPDLWGDPFHDSISAEKVLPYPVSKGGQSLSRVQKTLIEKFKPLIEAEKQIEDIHELYRKSFVREPDSRVNIEKIITIVTLLLQGHTLEEVGQQFNYSRQNISLIQIEYTRRVREQFVREGGKLE